MQRYEYRAVPAPKKGKKAKGVRGAEARFAHALTDCMNDMAAEGWEYLRTDTLPSEERTGLTGRTTVFQNMLVFRREVTGDAVVQPSSLGAQVEALRASGHDVVTVDLSEYLAVGELLYGPWVAERAESVGDFVRAHVDEVDPVEIGLSEGFGGDLAGFQGLGQFRQGFGGPAFGGIADGRFAVRHGRLSCARPFGRRACGQGER